MNETAAVLYVATVYGRAAFAYIDPATTSYVIQIVVGAVIAIGTFLGIYRNKLKRLFKKKQDDAVAPIEKNDVESKDVVTAEDLLDD